MHCSNYKHFVCMGVGLLESVRVDRQLISHLCLAMFPKACARRQPLIVRGNILIAFFIKTVDSHRVEHLATAQQYNGEDVLLPGRETSFPEG